MAHQHELVVMQMREQRQGATTVDATTHFQRHRSSGCSRGKWHKDRPTDAGTGAHSNSYCTRCATVHKQGNCPARGKKRHKLQKMSHFARCCQSTQAVNQVHAGQSQSYAEESQASGTEHYFLGAVGLGSEQGSPWHHTLNVCGQDISFKIGMGMDVNVTSWRTY